VTTRQLTVGASIAVAACYWSVYAVCWSRIASLRAVSAVRASPMSGTRVDLTAHVAPIGIRGTAHAAARRTLFLLSSDTCPETRALLPAWIDLIQALPFRDGDAVAVLSLSGDEVPTALGDAAAKRGVPYSLQRLTDVAAFMSATGMNFTPGTFVLDSDHRVRLIFGTKQRTHMAAEVSAFFDGSGNETADVGLRSRR